MGPITVDVNTIQGEAGTGGLGNNVFGTAGDTNGIDGLIVETGGTGGT